MGIFITDLVPPTLLFPPLSRVVTLLGWSDRLWALAVTCPTFLGSFCTWLPMGDLRTLPRKIEACAMGDASARLQALLGSVPTEVVSSCVTNRLVGGLTAGATKG